MKEDTTISQIHQPGSIIDPLAEIARDGMRRMLAAALKAEAASFIAQFDEERLPDGRQRVVRHGSGPERLDRHRAYPDTAPEGARSAGLAELDVALA
ncbi:hypothetical protein [Roseibium aggregatum]|uniref:hypothetical protein n=1 Tax=Roseibium aggregatum TaxID=187304 RepID=UPI0016818676